MRLPVSQSIARAAWNHSLCGGVVVDCSKFMFAACLRISCQFSASISSWRWILISGMVL